MVSLNVLETVTKNVLYAKYFFAQGFELTNFSTDNKIASFCSATVSNSSAIRRCNQ